MRFGEPNENFSEKFMHFEPSALYHSKWEEDELGATSSETRSHADKSDKALWSVSNQTDCKYFERITLSEFISSTQLCFKRHSAKCIKCECSKPTAKIPIGTQIFSIQI